MWKMDEWKKEGVGRKKGEGNGRRKGVEGRIWEKEREEKGRRWERVKKKRGEGRGGWGRERERTE